MQEIEKPRVRQELKELVTEASHSLARLDADRLEELALCCQALNRDLASMDAVGHLVLAGQAKDAIRDMALFSRILDATRANLKVMERLRELRLGRAGYGEAVAGARRGWVRAEENYGDD